jgi:hypothetical protein
LSTLFWISVILAAEVIVAEAIFRAIHYLNNHH